jgi:hypothetical protein
MKIIIDGPQSKDKIPAGSIDTGSKNYSTSLSRTGILRLHGGNSAACGQEDINNGLLITRQ